MNNVGPQAWLADVRARFADHPETIDMTAAVLRLKVTLDDKADAEEIASSVTACLTGGLRSSGPRSRQCAGGRSRGPRNRGAGGRRVYRVALEPDGDGLPVRTMKM
jgi:hypothetical protein